MITRQLTLYHIIDPLPYTINPLPTDLNSHFSGGRVIDKELHSSIEVGGESVLLDWSNSL